MIFLIEGRLRLIREPAVAGQFYLASATSLRNQIEEFIDIDAQKIEAKGVVLPHAGYIYSGAVAGKTISSVNIPQTCVILGPNHTGLGSNFSIMTEGTWATPLGNVEIDKELATKILSSSKFLKQDFSAHRYEHSLEVEIPFLQYFKKSCKIVPIVASVGNLDTYRAIGKEISSAIKALSKEKEVLIIASSDMTHYEPQDQARKKDFEAIDAVLKLDEELLLKKIRSLDISMCGFAPVVIMLSCIKELGANQARLVMYQTSGDVTKDYSSVVGYAGIVLN
ncbi:MAG: AmmeMemoRadiSam system protein B [Candidatus Omnitrophota bacterium]|nr:AmmeMemoRadiSam system protein B [Candidatus Omnitrophota bacterium]